VLRQDPARSARGGRRSGHWKGVSELRSSQTGPTSSRGGSDAGWAPTGLGTPVSPSWRGTGPPLRPQLAGNCAAAPQKQLQRKGDGLEKDTQQLQPRGRQIEIHWVCPPRRQGFPSTECCHPARAPRTRQPPSKKLSPVRPSRGRVAVLVRAPARLRACSSQR